MWNTESVGVISVLQLEILDFEKLGSLSQTASKGQTGPSNSYPCSSKVHPSAKVYGHPQTNIYLKQLLALQIFSFYC